MPTIVSKLRKRFVRSVVNAIRTVSLDFIRRTIAYWALEETAVVGRGHDADFHQVGGTRDP